MSQSTTAPEAPSAQPDAVAPRSGVVSMIVRGLGWLFIGVGAFLLLYLVWLLWFTGQGTKAAQEDMVAEFQGLSAFEGFGDGQVAGDILGGDGDDPTLGGGDSDDADAVEIGTALALMEFERPGSDEAPVKDGLIAIVEGTSLAALQRGPGHYSDTVGPGGDGNFAVAGHRTTYGAPFYNLDEIQPGDLIHVTDRAGERFTYEVLDGSTPGANPGQHIVGPSETWVLARDPQGLGVPILTLTTCHPRFDASQRMIVFAELKS